MNPAYSLSHGVYAPPRLVTRLDDCEFYHTMDIPGYGVVRGPWDLRGYVDAYLGGIDLRGKRVLELGTASGFLCREMEARGAEVVAFDLSEEFDGDIVSFARTESPETLAARRRYIRRMNNGWWLAHRACGSSARVVYGSAYDIPAGIGEVDIATFGSILLHLRDPYRALASAARLVRETIVVTDPPCHWDRFPPAPPADAFPQPPGGWHGRLLRLAHRFLGDRGWWKREEELRARLSATAADYRALLDSPITMFLPDPANPEQNMAWWCFRSQTIVAMLRTLGFPHATVTETDGPLDHDLPQRLFTVVARR